MKRSKLNGKHQVLEVQLRDKIWTKQPAHKGHTPTNEIGLDG